MPSTQSIAMEASSIIDSHIHLWPASTANEDGHKWMTPGMPLAKQHLLQDYFTASQPRRDDASDHEVEAVVYVETDSRYAADNGRHISEWATGPLREITYLREVVEGRHGERASKVLAGIVLWAPMDHETAVLEQWLRVAEEAAGAATWRRVKGVRFLLQAYHDRDEFEQLVFSERLICNLRLLGRRGLSFDVGVDQHRAGVWQVQAMSEVIRRVHQDVVERDQTSFILNHLCKPDFEEHGLSFREWTTAMEMISRHPKIYMKLSGAFSEMPDNITTVEQAATCIIPWATQVFKSFGPSRTMFGSDWPVCNVRGIRGEASWIAWKDVVSCVLSDKSLSLTDEEKQQVWRKTAMEAYRLR